MMSKLMYLVVVVFALVTLACGVTINLPVEQMESGPTRTKEILIENPDASSAEITLAFGAGKLNISPGVESALITGEATYNLDQLEPKISVEGEKIRLQTGDSDFKRLPRFGEDIKNVWELQLGDMPMDLMINAGAYQGDIELGGLSLKTLEVSDGAADVGLRFSQANKIEMDTLRYLTGASSVRLSGLANANFSSMIFRSGAGDYTLDFSGELKRDAVVSIESGISQVVVVVPEGMNAKVYFKGGLANVEVDRGWKHSGDQYALEGDGPQLIIHIDMGAGNLVLKTD